MAIEKYEELHWFGLNADRAGLTTPPLGLLFTETDGDKKSFVYANNTWLEVGGQALPNTFASDQSTGTVIDLNLTQTTYYNTVNAATAYTTTNLVIGGTAQVLINAATEPNVTGATKISGAPFEANTDMYLIIYTPDGTNVEFFFLKR